jgi:hypothetical protein
MKLEDQIQLGISLLTNFHLSSNEEIVNRLMECNIPEDLAWEIILFVPMAFCRVMFRDAGIEFPSVCIFETQDILSDREYKLFTEIEIYCSALKIATSQISKGFDYFLNIAYRSCEYQSIEKLTQQRSKLDSIRLVSPIFSF